MNDLAFVRENGSRGRFRLCFVTWQFSVLLCVLHGSAQGIPVVVSLSYEGAV